MAELLGEENNTADASTSAPSRPLCSICNQKPPVYTCPRCRTRTCSLPCSTAHKTNSGCSGERNKVEYVSMNQYGWGTMVNDYTFLEDVSRKVADWGLEIVKGGYGTGNSGKARGGKPWERGRGRGGRGGGGGGGNTRTKRDILKMQLDVRDIDMELLPIGMHRRKINQSTWDFKNRTAILTVEFIFHSTPNPLATDPPSQPYTLLTHKNSMKTPLLQLIQTHVSERVKNTKKESNIPPWVQSLVLPHPDDPEGFTCPHFAMPAPFDPIAKLYTKAKSKKAYYKFEADAPLDTLLRNTQFIEFPTIEIREDFNGIIVDKQGLVTEEGEEHMVKRRKLNTKAGKRAITGLLAGYGSEEGEEDGEEEQTGISLLGNYAGSGDENDAGDMEVDLEDSDGEVDGAEPDPVLLLELLRQARGGEPLEVEEDDSGDSEEVEAE